MNEKCRKRIFIGSSSECWPLAEMIKDEAEQKYQFVTWYENFFRLGDYVFNDLIKKAITFDFAIMLGGKDDRVTRLSTQKDKLSPRDNIYLEYGLFSGVLSPNRVLFLIHEDCEVASDLTGMTMETYRTDEQALAKCRAWLHRQSAISRREFNEKEIELLPTVGIAVGYFHNFVRTFTDKIRNLESIQLEERTYPIKTKKLVICIPDFVCSNVADYKTDMMERWKLKEDSIVKFRVLYDPKALERHELVIYDIPSTLMAVYKTVDFIFGISDDRNTEDTICAKQRALDNFYDNISAIIDDHFLTKRIASVERYTDR